MSLLETPMTRWYWQQVGGTLIEEFVAVRGSRTCGRRWLDGVIVLDGERRIARQSEISFEGKDIIVVQTKARRLGMYLMGQAFFSAQLMQRFNPRSVRSVALCLADDEVLRPLFEQYPHMEVIVYPVSARARSADALSSA
jgi:RNA polymerase subunit RPABC4/transcription elongation factor Spt4